MKEKSKYKKVFIIEDNNLNRHLFCELIQILGAKAIPFADAEEAFSQLNKEIPDLILLDLNLSGISGQEFVQELTNSPSFKNIPIIVASAFPEDQKILDMGIKDYIAKPISVLNFMERISKFLN